MFLYLRKIQHFLWILILARKRARKAEIEMFRKENTG